jgi:hypothetical protein
VPGRRFEARDMGVSGVSGGVPYDDNVEEAPRVCGVIVGLDEVGIPGMGLAFEPGGATIDEREGGDMWACFDTIWRGNVG